MPQRDYKELSLNYTRVMPIHQISVQNKDSGAIMWCKDR